ncbi:Penicillin-binding protein 2D [Corynebacterium occultum]|uniref:Penicillin-binding protein 2D n=1 Tax=Corynebacterium occultum TaxID=2675219 RepID=A0A6B8W4D4_9CORY|nr:transglycosylase domain-containing protein [Corynebacterium occultum]QGU06265.1 Penicillin-binding protein 2D [Corynebacterium occultum]
MSVSKSFRNVLGATLAAALVGALALAPLAGVSGVATARINETMQSNLSDMTGGETPGVTTVTDVEGSPMAYIFKQRRHPVESEQIAQTVKDAIVSIEDRRFYEHEGVDLQGFARAMITNVMAGGVEEGASTINQQYVKNYLLLVDAETEEEQAVAVETSIPRKLREMRMASDLDQLLTKDEVLTRYLNLVPFGNGAYGIEAASRTYFGIPAAELNVPQAAMLAGIPQSSSLLNPYTNVEGVTQRRNTVLQSMVEAGYLDQASSDQYQQQPLGVMESPATLPNGCIGADDRGFFCDYALTYLESKGIPRDELATGGYTIQTTLDPAVQDIAHNSVTTYVNPDTPGVASVLNVIEPGEESRDILAMTSSRDYGLNLEEGETMLPQPSSLIGNGAGSIFKIFTAAAAIDQGMTLDTILDVPTRYEATGMGTGGAAGCPANTYCVENAGSYRSQMPLIDALAQSPNTTFIQMIEQVGVTPVVDMSVKLGLRSYESEGSHSEGYSIADYMRDANLGSYTLGPTAVNPLELSNVGATLASHGTWCEPNPISSVINRKGEEVYLERPECEQAIDPEVADTLTVGLSRDAQNGTAAGAAQSTGWNAPIAAKTGTTESHQSSAFLGFNSNIAAAPYIYNDGTNTMSLCTSPVQQCSSGGLYGGLEPARTFFTMANQIPAATSGTLPERTADMISGESGAGLDAPAGEGGADNSAPVAPQPAPAAPSQERNTSRNDSPPPPAPAIPNIRPEDIDAIRQDIGDAINSFLP